ncbi:hypothetical protein [Nocardia nova]|uniref:hypothetical protein n=1 Tax=Nocardia nova TaxID=37330 RepID=UPI000CEA4341|nr:hypothetical protein [Nocardia nova]MBV7702793.1 hypothetical protein [Nocardia nova]PPJ02301.1 hypothetical protein C5E51_30575 [Nocardia nova]
MTPPSSEDARFWRLATWGVAGFFLLQLVVMIIAARVMHSDTDGTIFGSFLAASVVGTLIASLLRWKARGPVRGVALAAVTTAGIWLGSSVIIGCLYFATR